MVHFVLGYLGTETPDPAGCHNSLVDVSSASFGLQIAADALYSFK